MHSTTGNVGYFGKRGSTSDNLQRRKTEPRFERTVSTCPHVEHRPGPIRGTTPQFDMAADRPARGCSKIERALLLNGVNQLSYTVTNPDTFPTAPPLASLTLAQNSIYRLDPKLRSDYLMQSAIDVERQLPRNTTVAVTYTNTRALHTAQTVPINTPLPGTYVLGQ